MSKKPHGLIAQTVFAVFAIISILFTLTVCDTGNGPDPDSGKIVLGTPLFKGDFDARLGKGVIQVFNENQVQGRSVRNIHSAHAARNVGTSGTSIVAAIEFEESGTVLLLEGPYDHVSGMFSLSARTDEGAFMLTGIMDSSNTMMSPVLSIFRPDGGEWDGVHAPIEPNNAANFTTSEATAIPSEVPSIIMGRHELYSDEGDLYGISLISPSGDVFLSYENGVFQETGNSVFLECEQISAKEIHVIVSSNEFDWTAFSAANEGKNPREKWLEELGLNQYEEHIWGHDPQYAFFYSPAHFEMYMIGKGYTPTIVYKKVGYLFHDGELWNKIDAEDSPDIAQARAFPLRKGFPLSAPENLSINNKVLSWDAVQNAVSYIVTINEETKIPVTGTSLNISAYLIGADSYNVYVIAIAAQGQVDWCDSGHSLILILDADGNLPENNEPGNPGGPGGYDPNCPMCTDPYTNCPIHGNP